MAVEVPKETGSLLTQRAGPLPMWGWGVVILGAAYGFKLYKDRKAGTGQARQSTTTSAGYQSSALPSNIQPFYTQVNEGGNQSYVNSPVTTIGRQVLTGDNSTGVSQVAQTQITTPPPPQTVTAPVPVVQAPQPQGQWLTVVKWNPNNRNAPSTLSGLALEAYGNASLWKKIWEAPQNASLRARRGDPTRIQPGDRFWAPA